MSDDVFTTPEGQRLRKFAPLEEDHPLVRDKTECPACNKVFQKGESPTLIALGPGDDEEAQERAQAGRVYNAVATAVHWTCATGQPV